MLRVPLSESDQPSASAICRHSIRALGFSQMQRWNLESPRVDGPRGFPSWQAPQSQPFRRLPASPATRANLEYPIEGLFRSNREIRQLAPHGLDALQRGGKLIPRAKRSHHFPHEVLKFSLTRRWRDAVFASPAGQLADR